MSQTLTALRSHRSLFFRRNLTHKILLTLLLVVGTSTLLWLNLQPVLSAPNALVSPPTPAPLSRVHLVDVPAEVLIGDDFTFFVTFDNSTPGSTVGFAPFVDLVLDSGGADHNNTPPLAGGPCDGIQLLAAEIVDVNGGPINVTPAPNIALCNTIPTSLSHPFGGTPFGPITVPAGGELRTIILPFGSYQLTQPTIKIKVTAHVHNFADLNYPLSIYARGGFRFGSDPLDNTGFDPGPYVSDTNANATAWTERASVKPTILKASKKYLGPEDETTTGPNFPRQYEIAVDVAQGQTVSNLVVTDCLQNNMQFLTVNSSVPAATSVVTPTSTSPCLQLTYASILGAAAAAGPEIKVIFSFFIVHDVSGTDVLDPNNCVNAISVDDVKGEGDWIPLDPRDGPTSQHAVSDVTPTDHKLTDKRIAIQKSPQILNNPGGTFRPGSVVRYTLDFQVADFFTVGKIVVNDALADGQNVVGVPTLMVKDRRKSTPTTFPFPPGTFSNLLDAGLSCGPANGIVVQGGRKLTFDVSTAMQMNAALFSGAPPLQQGILTGGHAFSPVASVAAVGQIVFFAQIQDKFDHPHQGDKWVDKHDPINNCVGISADIFTNDPLVPITKGFSCGDDSGTALLLPGDVLEKKIVARNGSITDPELGHNPPRFSAGDRITFRLRKILPSADYEKLTIQDWFPLPVLPLTSSMTLDPLPCSGIPISGHICRGSGHTLTVIPTLLPISLSDNSLTLNYGSHNETANFPKTIELFVTLTVSANPYADGLFLTNEAQECELNSFAMSFCQVALAQFELTEPNVRIRKGVIASSNPNSTFSLPPSVTNVNALTNMGGSCPPPALCPHVWTSSSTITSTDLNNPNYFNSDLYTADAGDWITYAIVVENRGSGINGAFDVKIQDSPTLHPGFAGPPGAWNLRAHDGTGAPFTLGPSGVWGLMTPTGEELQDPGPTAIDPGSLDRFSLTSGRNLAIVTYNMHLKSAADVKMGDCYDNAADLLHYAAREQGADFVSAGFSSQPHDTAKVCVNPTLTKSIVATSEAHTVPQTAPPGTVDGTIGELVRYRLVVRLPEGVGPNFQIIDPLPGMKFRNDNSARLAFISTGGISHSTSFGPIFDVVGNAPLSSATLNTLPPVPPSAISGGLNCGDPVAFNLGNVQNNDNDGDLEYVVVEFNALVCNVMGNQMGTTLTNTFIVSVDKTTIATSNPIDVRVVEPNLTLTKTVAPNPATKGQTLTYAVKYTNTGTADAFDVDLKDTLPAGLVLGTITAGCPVTSNTGNGFTVSCAQIPIGATVIVVYQAVANPEKCPVKLENRATLNWTSLPGPKGTIVNPTGSSTPGNSGADDGERDGVTLLLTLNDYAANASAVATIDCPCNATINGAKFNDLNGNGVRDQGEPGLPNWTIKITGPNGFSQTVTTDAQGNYTITVPAPGTYTVTEISQSGWTQTAPNSGSYTVTLSPGQVVNNRDFGNRKKNECDLQITKEVEPNPVLSGQPATFIITVKNVGTGPCHGPTTVTESLPPISASGSGWTCTGATCTYAGNINAGASVSLTYTYNVTAQPGTIIENCVKLKNESDGNTANNQACIEVKVEEGHEPKCLEATDEKIACNANGTFTYSLTVTNVSSSTMSYLTFTPITSNVTITPASMSIPLLASGASMNVTLTIGGTGAVPGASICFLFGGGPLGAVGCKVQHCIKLPKCPVTETGSLTVTKAVQNLSPAPIPTGTNFPITVSCSPSGPNVTLNLAAAGTQTVNNIPIGSACTVTEGALPPPIAHPACANLGWGTPTYSPGQNVSITTAGAAVAVQVKNVYQCNTCAPPPPGMVAWWPLNESTGAVVVNDIIGFNNQGTPKSGGSLGSANSPAAIAGQVGGAVNFKSNLQSLATNTGAANIEVPDHDEIDFGTGDLSIDAWVRMPALPPSDVPTQSRLIVGKLEPTRSALATTGTGYALSLVASPANGASLQFTMGDGGPLVSYTTRERFVPFDTWTHVVVTVDRKGGKVSFYINGQLVPATEATMPKGSVSNGSSLLIGGSNIGGQGFLNTIFLYPEVSLDEIEMFKRLLTSPEIQSIFNAGPSGKCRATINGLKFNDLNGNGARDPGEPGLANWTIKITDSSGNTQTVTTDSQGNYSFTVPAPGTYTLSEVLQSGWTQTAPSSGSYTVSVLPGQVVNNRDFGNKKKQQEDCDLQIRKEGKPNPVVSGQQVAFIITVQNVGHGPCYGPVTVTESLPPVATAGSGWICTGANCTYGAPINPGTGASVTYTYNATEKPGTIFKNCVTLKSDGDVNPANNEACIEVKVDEAKAPDPKGNLWDVILVVGFRGQSNVSLRNGCKKTHDFEVTPRDLPFLQLQDKATVKVPGASTQNLPVIFDTRGLQPGLYEGKVEVDCKTCRQEKGCTQDRQTIPVRLTVTPAPTARPPG